MNERPLENFGLGGRFDRALCEEPAPTFPYGSDSYWMEQALIESMKSAGISSPNPGVGCVIVKEGRELSRGFTQAFRGEHAERQAFSRLPEGASLVGATAYVTLEPCSHFGHQPPCADLLVKSSVSRVVIAMMDPDPRVNGEGVQKLKASGKEVVVGVLEREARAIHFPFIRTRVSKSVVWVAKWAQMPSGHLSDRYGNSKWITNEQSRAYTHWLRQKYDCILVGAETFLKDRPQLTVRDCALPHQRQPVRVVYDPSDRLLSLSPEELKGFHRLGSEINSRDNPHALRMAVENLPFQNPLQSVMVEGGARLLNHLLQADAFDAAHVFTGAQRFHELDEKARVHWIPSGKWACVAEHKFKDDLLQEWTKED
jgi:diaminohydroxyphosphoribosylaminopyrimidine deaminase/5-amino-6-(5-phosphoribosylamino)uracil reductase